MKIVPQPRKITPAEGTVSLDKPWKLEAGGELVSLECLADLGFIADDGDRSFVLRLDDSIEGIEEYRLKLSPDHIELVARTRKGIIAGIQTLRQLERQSPVGACVIEDSPALRIRGMHIDFRPKSYNFDYLLHTIDRLAELKYNYLLVEWEDKFPYKRMSEVVHPEALTNEQVAALRTRCAKYDIEIMPLVQTFGHLQFVFGLPRYAHLREVPEESSEICPLKEEAVDLVKDLLRDIIDGHPESEYIHVGSDEAFVMGSCPECKANCEKVGRSRHFIDHMKKIVQVVIDAGKTPVMWNDMLIGHPEAIPMLPGELVMLDWHYHVSGVYNEETAAWQHNGPFTADTLGAAPEIFREEFAPYIAGEHPSDPKLLRSFPYTKYFMDKGFGVIAGPSSCAWGDPGTNPNHETHVPNIWGFAASAALDEALGCILTSWQVRRHPWEVQYYCIALCAETMWNPTEGIRDDFDARFMQTQYGIDDATIPKAFYLLDRKMDEDRCDHYGRGYDDENRRWVEGSIAEQMERKEKEDNLTDESPSLVRADECVRKATEAARTFERFVNAAKRNKLDAQFWALAAEETIFRVDLFRVMRLVYLARKEGSSPGAALEAEVAEIIERGDSLYAESEKLWKQILPPLTLSEEMLTRWGEPRGFLTEE